MTSELSRLDQIAAAHKDKTEPAFTVSPTDMNCLSFWYPKIVHRVRTPDTFFVRVSDGWRLAGLLDGEHCFYFDALCAMLGGAIDCIGTPCFLRTGQGSGKHEWDTCCFLVDKTDLKQHIVNLVGWSHMVDMMGLPHDVWVVRKMLPTKPLFRCTRYGNMPVVREWRYFVNGDKILYGIPYWPKSALSQGAPDKAGWCDDLPYLHEEPPIEAANLAAIAGDCMGSEWSVDLLETTDGWYVTDMAIAARSYGWNPDRIK